MAGGQDTTWGEADPPWTPPSFRAPREICPLAHRLGSVPSAPRPHSPDAFHSQHLSQWASLVCGMICFTSACALVSSFLAVRGHVCVGQYSELDV